MDQLCLVVAGKCGRLDAEGCTGLRVGPWLFPLFVWVTFSLM